MAKALKEDYTPTPDERVWYRRASDGQKGYFCRRGGKDYILLDRPMEEVLLPFRKREWISDSQTRPLTKAQVAFIAFEADKAMCQVLGQFELARRDWQMLRDQERLDFIKDGPDATGPRALQWRALMGYLSTISK